MFALTLPRPAAIRQPAPDLSPSLRAFLATGAAIVFGLIAWTLARALLGFAPGGAALKEVALAIHLAAVVPAIPLGGWVLLQRKGTPRHRLLGKIWLALMVTGAVAAFWVRHLNGGRLSPIHLLIPVVLVGSWRAVASARRGNIRAHKRGLLLLFVTGLLLPGLAAFQPGRLMWVWLVG